jgi:hypothetical protein
MKQKVESIFRKAQPRQPPTVPELLNVCLAWMSGFESVRKIKWVAVMAN